MSWNDRWRRTVSQAAHSEIAVLGVLLMAAVVCFAAVTALVGRFRLREHVLSVHLHQRGEAELAAGQLGRALEDLRSALRFDPTNYDYQFSLARALAAAGRPEEATVYFSGLWEQQPQDGSVNLELARLEAGKGRLEQAERYYNNSIYGFLRKDAAENRRRARLELVHFFLQQGRFTQAQSELIAMASGLPPDPGVHLEVADLFLKARDPGNALNQYESVLRASRKNRVALAGAGKAAFDLGRYRTARRYLEEASELGGLDDESSRMLQTADLILANDPFRQGLSERERNRRVLRAFQQAGWRLQQCEGKGLAQHTTAAGPSALPDLQTRWSQLKPKLNPLGLRRNPEVSESAMELVYQIENAAAAECGQPAGLDEALLLMGRDRQGVER